MAVYVPCVIRQCQLNVCMDSQPHRQLNNLGIVQQRFTALLEHSVYAMNCNSFFVINVTYHLYFSTLILSVSLKHTFEFLFSIIFPTVGLIKIF